MSDEAEAFFFLPEHGSSAVVCVTLQDSCPTATYYYCLHPQVYGCSCAHFIHEHVILSENLGGVCCTQEVLARLEQEAAERKRHVEVIRSRITRDKLLFCGPELPFRKKAPILIVQVGCLKHCFPTNILGHIKTALTQS